MKKKKGNFTFFVGNWAELSFRGNVKYIVYWLSTTLCGAGYYYREDLRTSDYNCLVSKSTKLKNKISMIWQIQKKSMWEFDDLWSRKSSLFLNHGIVKWYLMCVCESNLWHLKWLTYTGVRFLTSIILISWLPIQSSIQTKFNFIQVLIFSNL